MTGNKNGYLESLSKKAKEQKTWFSTQLEITDACNFRCKHCYLDKKADFLSLEDIDYISQALVEIGVLHVTLSGGDPLIHPNFFDIYTKLKNAGMLITLFTNGSLLTPDVIKKLSESKPIRIEVSIYGSNDQNYQEFVQRPGMYTTVMNNLKLAAESGLPIVIKGSLRKDLPDMADCLENMAKEIGCKYFHTSMIFGTETGDKSPSEMKLPAQQVVEIECRKEDAIKDWIEKYKTGKLKRELSCIGGVTSFVINPNKTLSMCTLIRSPKFSFYDKESFLDALNKGVRSRRSEIEELYRQSACAKCEMSHICPNCPGISNLEVGDYCACTPYSKSYSTNVLKQIQENL